MPIGVLLFSILILECGKCIFVTQRSMLIIYQSVRSYSVPFAKAEDITLLEYLHCLYLTIYIEFAVSKVRPPRRFCAARLPIQTYYTLVVGFVAGRYDRSGSMQF